MANIILVGDFIYDGRVGRGGQTMHVLQWLRGLERLGHRILFLEFVDQTQLQQQDATLSAFGKIIEEWWHRAQTAVFCEDESVYGMSRSEAVRFIRSASGVITLGVPGHRNPQPLLENVRPRILIELDPGYTHLWVDGDPKEIFGEQDFYFTVGGNIGSSRCRVPTHNLHWRPIWNPVVLEWWPQNARIESDRFTTVADWYFYGYLEFEGKTFGPKAEEFPKFIELPQLSGAAFEIALEIEPDDPAIGRLQEHGWKLQNPAMVGTPNLYRDFIIGSAGEFSCAKGGYVGTRCGWFSDRSACYLAAGRPVVLQDTGFADLLPTGEGLFAVRSVEEAEAAVRAIRRDYQKHSTAARNIALERFDSDKILKRLLSEAGVNE